MILTLLAYAAGAASLATFNVVFPSKVAKLSNNIKKLADKHGVDLDKVADIADLADVLKRLKGE